ncbi:hypothetical protein TCCBUS3UF1_2920 [Thermus sp. CCB_US3_UF1]|nr:hypothetical protein TCCBUS3UF1_2920 [Thermus sp. CCB_US3_UF1]
MATLSITGPPLSGHPQSSPKEVRNFIAHRSMSGGEGIQASA